MNNILLEEVREFWNRVASDWEIPVGKDGDRQIAQAIADEFFLAIQQLQEL